MLTGEEVLNNRSVLYKNLYVKHVKINEVLKTREEKYVGQSHPASKSLNVIKEKKIGPQLHSVSRNQFC